MINPALARVGLAGLIVLGLSVAAFGFSLRRAQLDAVGCGLFILAGAVAAERTWV